MVKPIPLHELETIFKKKSYIRSSVEVQKIYTYLISRTNIQEEIFWYIFTNRKTHHDFCRAMDIHYIYENEGLNFTIPCHCHQQHHQRRKSYHWSHSSLSTALFIVLRGEVHLTNMCPNCSHRSHQHPSKSESIILKAGSLFGQIHLPSTLYPLAKKKATKKQTSNLKRDLENMSPKTIPLMDENIFFRECSKEITIARKMNESNFKYFPSKTNVSVHLTKGTIFLSLPSQRCVSQISKLEEKVYVYNLLQKYKLQSYFANTNEYKIVTFPPHYWLIKEQMHLSKNIYLILSGHCQIWKNKNGEKNDDVKSKNTTQCNDCSIDDNDDVFKDMILIGTNCRGPFSILGLIPCLLDKKNEAKIDPPSEKNPDSSIAMNYLSQSCERRVENNLFTNEQNSVDTDRNDDKPITTIHDEYESFSALTLTNLKAIVIPSIVFRCKISQTVELRNQFLRLAQEQHDWIQKIFHLHLEKIKAETENKVISDDLMLEDSSYNLFPNNIMSNPRLKKRLFLLELMKCLQCENQLSLDDIINQPENNDILSDIDDDFDIDGEDTENDGNASMNIPDIELMNPFPTVICNRKYYGKTLPLIEHSKGYQIAFQTYYTA